MDNFSSVHSFLKDFLANLNISMVTIDAASLAHVDKNQPNIYNVLYSRESVERYYAHILSNYKEKILYKVTNLLMCSYYLFILPGEKKRCCIIGPFLERTVTKGNILTFMEQHDMRDETYNTLANFYSSLRKIDNISVLQALLNTYMSVLWGGIDQFELQSVGTEIFDSELEIAEKTEETSATKTLNEMKMLQERYDIENELLRAVSRGELHTAEMLAHRFESMQVAENRAADPLRNLKNYSIIFNSLFRKAAETGKVHPIHINQLSSQIAYKIEACKSLEEITALRKEMIRKYCFLVKNHSMSNFSMLVQKVLTIINNDLSANLSLSVLAEELNVNASYLSTQFKKEVGQTITDYVTEKRIQHAILLLNSTDMQISAISQSCGIEDIQYFSKLFKKRIGYTPSEYRKEIRYNYDN